MALPGLALLDGIPEGSGDIRGGEVGLELWGDLAEGLGFVDVCDFEEFLVGELDAAGGVGDQDGDGALGDGEGEDLERFFDLVADEGGADA